MYNLTERSNGTMATENTNDLPSISLEENLKKALTELLILHLLSQRQYYIGELTSTLSEKSNNVLNIVFPYSAIYRMLQAKHIFECEKRIAPDGRRRQYFQITDRGRAYYNELMKIYNKFSSGINVVLSDNTLG
jgi:PadR family transcriptional regulator PadR